MPAINSDRLALKTIIDSYVIHVSHDWHAFARFEDPAGPVGTLLPLSGPDLIDDIQSRYTQQENCSISWQSINDAIAPLRHRAKDMSGPTRLKIIGAIATLPTIQNGPSLVLRASNGRYIYSGYAGCSVIDADALAKYGGVPIDQSGKKSIWLADRVEKRLTTDKYLFTGSAKPLDALFKLFEDDVPGVDATGRAIIIGWLLGVLSKNTMPILLLTGPRGSGKTYLAEMIARLFNRNGGYNCALPVKPQNVEKKLMAEAVVVFDNVRRIPTAVSDELCRLITSGDTAPAGPQFTGYGHISAARIIMTSIHNPVESEDLVSRTLTVEVRSSVGNRSCRTSDAVSSDIAVNLLGVLQKMREKGLIASAPRSDPPYRFPAFLEQINSIQVALAPKQGDMTAALNEVTRIADESAGEEEPLVILLEELLTMQTTGFKGSANTLIGLLRKSETSKLWRNQPWLILPRSLSVMLKNLKHTLHVRNIGYSKVSARDHEIVKLPDIEPDKQLPADVLIPAISLPTSSLAA